MSLFSKKKDQPSLKDKYPTLDQALSAAGIEKVEQSKDGAIEFSADELASIEQVLADATDTNETLEQTVADQKATLSQKDQAIAQKEKELKELKAANQKAEEALTAAAKEAEVEEKDTMAETIGAVTGKIKALGKQPGATPAADKTEKEKEDTPDKGEQPEAELSEADAEGQRLYNELHGEEAETK